MFGSSHHEYTEEVVPGVAYRRVCKLTGSATTYIVGGQREVNSTDRGSWTERGTFKDDTGKTK